MSEHAVDDFAELPPGDDGGIYPTGEDASRQSAAGSSPAVSTDFDDLAATAARAPEESADRDGRPGHEEPRTGSDALRRPIPGRPDFLLPCPIKPCPVPVYGETVAARFSLLARHMDETHPELGHADPEPEPTPQLVLPVPDEFAGLFGTSIDPQSGDVKITLPEPE